MGSAARTYMQFITTFTKQFRKLTQISQGHQCSIRIHYIAHTRTHPHSVQPVPHRSKRPVANINHTLESPHDPFLHARPSHLDRVQVPKNTPVCSRKRFSIRSSSLLWPDLKESETACLMRYLPPPMITNSSTASQDQRDPRLE